MQLSRSAPGDHRGHILLLGRRGDPGRRSGLRCLPRMTSFGALTASFTAALELLTSRLFLRPLRPSLLRSQHGRHQRRRPLTWPNSSLSSRCLGKRRS